MDRRPVAILSPAGENAISSNKKRSMHEHLLYQIAVTLLPNVGAITAKNLIGYCGSAKAVFSASKKALLRIPGVGPRIVESIGRRQVLGQAERELRFVEESGIQAFSYFDDGYPRRLRPYPDCPVLLYYRGAADLNANRTVAIVGTRKPTAQGTAVCEALVEQLQPYEVLLVSGLAFGIDAAAHRRSLEAGIPTVGVLGHGLRSVYPAQHRQLAEKMTAAGGLLTEFTSNTGPEREHFPMRNRIIAGLCDALIVVETGAKGGSMISALFANDYHKDVFAVPGRIRDLKSAGCNQLIKSHKAHLLENIEDLAYVMRWEKADECRPGVQTQLFAELDDAEKLIVTLLDKSTEVSIDDLTYQTKLSNSEMAALLLSLEFKGVIRSLPGKRYLLA